MESGNSSGSVYTTTPLKGEGSSFIARHQIYGRNDSPYKTPVRGKFKTTNETNTSKPHTEKGMIIEKMPIYSPPKKNVNFVKNPFEHPRLLKEKLSKPICSPSLFKPVSSPAQNEDFSWNIDDISVLHPADIDENPSQDYNSLFSPVTENEAQEIINRFFSNNMAGLESPVVKGVNRSSLKRGLKEKPLTLDTWSQTDLSFPPDLPPEVKAVLANYCNFNTSQTGSKGDDLDSSTSSNFRKKLLFRNFGCETPVVKAHSTNVSTPITSRPSSPDISPVQSYSPMDIDVHKKSVKLNMTTDMNISEKQNSPRDWNYQLQGCSTPAPTSSFDSAFSSM